MPLISICIPAYKNADYLYRLLKSISDQTYKDFEVIITDDTPDESLESVIEPFKTCCKIIYIKNNISLGTPANWNFAISKAHGKWVKLMHHDDWFASEKSLESFATVARDNNESEFIFSGFVEVSNHSNKKKYVISTLEKFLLNRSPLNLFKKNFVGHPSTTLIKNNQLNWYDENVKWVVDFEFYMRCLKKTNFIAIDEPLVNIGVHNNQVTKEAFRNPAIEIPENLYLINKLGENSLKNIFVYDYYWRLFRNLEIRNIPAITSFSNNNKLPKTIKKMLDFQFRIPLPLLKVGIFSKALMLLSKKFI